ncbi:Nucleic acid-binding proteins superfamily [Zea mays]|uniref:Nucleic acid-binding proteins superfamily n=1 Tax=Zea mays TaxID=4577 RepID=A0A1D6PCF9_MAIZE|nr:Nucleic acid-binding proteins superfamily [Zea mays]AQL07306.1 Nucleic acid-binding proteins superfamily [Zea mays]AQL07307.1 Nucleic acid-binding proteins superfamily [Zea mays]AQL07308.1 Nucleic acid-binding proteins superfamily [Zea mays]
MEHMRFDIMSGSIRILVVLCLKLLRTRKSPAKQTARNLFRGGDDEDDSADADTNDPVVPWSLGRVGVGHMVYISGLTCALSSTNILEVSWREKEPGSLFVNLSLLPYADAEKLL